MPRYDMAISSLSEQSMTRASNRCIIEDEKDSVKPSLLCLSIAPPYGMIVTIM